MSKGRLVCVTSGVFGETSGDVIVELNGPSVGLGRAKTNDTVIEASGVSRNHVEVSFKDQGWHIQDVGSSNGILVNKSEVAQAWLTAGDVISIGAVHYKFSLDDAAVVEDAQQQVSLFDVEKTLVLNQEDVRAGTARQASPVNPKQRTVSKDNSSSWVLAGAMGAVVIITVSLSFL